MPGTQITNVGLFDNTFLTDIIDNFLGATPSTYIVRPTGNTGIGLDVYPNPAGNSATIKLELSNRANVVVRYPPDELHLA